MISRKLVLSLCALAVLPMPVAAFAQDAEMQTQRRMNGMDADKDGSVSLAEFTEFRRNWTSKRDDAEMQMQPDVVQRAFGKLDRDGDGAISHEELLKDTKARMKKK